MDPCLKEDICRTERWIRRVSGYDAGGSRTVYGEPFKLLVALERDRSIPQTAGGTQLSPDNFIISEEELCEGDRVYATFAEASDDTSTAFQTIKRVVALPDLECGADLNAVDHYESYFSSST